MTSKPVRLIRFDGVQAIIPLGHSALYEEMARGQFPKPIKLTSATGKSAAVAWIESEIYEFVNRKIAESRGAASSGQAQDDSSDSGES